MGRGAKGSNTDRKKECGKECTKRKIIKIEGKKGSQDNTDVKKRKERYQETKDRRKENTDGKKRKDVRKEKRAHTPLGPLHKGSGSKQCRGSGALTFPEKELWPPQINSPYSSRPT